jgi:hypothetical protein
VSDAGLDVWFCGECYVHRSLNGEAGFECDAPGDCPRFDEWGDNCGHIVCEECHVPFWDRYFPGLLDVDGGKVGAA